MTSPSLLQRSFFLLPALLLISACSEPPRPANSGSTKAPIAVESMTVQTHSIPLLYTATGSVHARTESQLASQVMARVLSVNVHPGDHVRAGQVLVSLDSQELNANFNKAEAGRAESQSTIAESDNAIAQAKANLDLANLTSQRMADLYAKRSISQQEFDEATAKLKTSQAAYEMARARREQLNNRIAQDDASLQQARASRSYTVLRAPFAGVITARNVEPGAITIPGAPLLIIEAGNTFRMHVAVEESRMSSLHLNDTVSVFIDSLQNQITGRIAELSPTSDTNAHSYTVKIDLPPNPALHAGLFGHVSFTAGNKPALTVPTNAIVENGQLQSVFVSDNGTARIRLITRGDARQDQTEILSGLQPGDSVIVPIPNGLADGDRVEQRQ